MNEKVRFGIMGCGPRGMQMARIAKLLPDCCRLTAMSDPADTAEMLHEMSTIGVTMAVIVTVVWALLCVVADIIVKRKANSPLENA